MKARPICGKRPTKKFMIIKNDKIKKLLEEKKPLVEEGRKVNGEIEKLMKEEKKLAAKILKINEKASRILDKEIGDEIGEFEAVTTFELTESGHIEVNILDAIEDLKQRIRDQKNKKAHQPDPIKK